MPSIDIFADEAFDAVRLTKRINDLPKVPTKLGDMGLFTEEGISTTQLSIEKTKSGLHLVPARARGAPPEPVTLGRPKPVFVHATHLPQRATVMADEVQNKRTFGLPNNNQSDIATVQALVDKKLAKMRAQLDLTIEWQRVGAIKGKILDYDGTSVLLDLFDTFGVTQQTFSMNLDDVNTKVRMQCVAIRRLIEAKLAGLGYTGLRALASPSFMDALVGHAAVERSFEQFAGGSALRNDPTAGGAAFPYGGITWDEYNGSIIQPGGDTGSAPPVQFVEEGYAYVYPEGVTEMFVTTFSPADYNEAVNTDGLPYYAKQRPKDFDKGIDMESQSNPLSMCTRPEAVIKVSLA